VENKINPWKERKSRRMGLIMKNICIGPRQDTEPISHFFFISIARRSEQSYDYQTDGHREKIPAVQDLP
jgi:hypothetical protein